MHRRQELHDTIEQFQQGFRQLDDADLSREAAQVEDLPAQTALALARIRIRSTAGWAERPSFPTQAPTTSCCAFINELVNPRCLKRWSARSTAWRPAASMTSSAVGSPATVSMNVGPCPTSKRCFTTMASSSHCTRTLSPDGQASLAPRIRGNYRVHSAGHDAPRWQLLCWRRCRQRRRGRSLLCLDAGRGEGCPWRIRGGPGVSRYGVTDGGNFAPGRSVLHRAVTLPPLEEARLAGWRERLLAARAERVRPGRDDNILTGWNALMIQGLCVAYQATGDPAHLAAARRAASFIEDKLTMPDGGVYRHWKDGTARCQVPGRLRLPGQRSH